MSNNQLSAKQAQALRRMRLVPPGSRAELRAWLRHFAGLHLPQRALCPGHHTPLDYLEHVFFERGGAEALKAGGAGGGGGGADTVVWACRGGGKTMIGAAATLLDLLFKPGLQVRILGGSREQSDKMYSYLCALIRHHFLDQLPAGERSITRKGFALANGSRVEILTQSQRAVRGTRVQKMRCDEVELFDPAVWSAAQLTTRSLLADPPKLGRPNAPTPTPAPGAPPTRVLAHGAVEVFSTLHRPSGLMAQLVARASCPLPELPPSLDPPAPRHKVFTWCIWDVVGQCLERDRPCAPCVLLPWCAGRARHADGFVPLTDVLALHARSTKRSWASEMLCHLPVPEHQVFAAFRPTSHVRLAPQAVLNPGQWVAEGSTEPGACRQWRAEAVIAGIDYGWQRFVCLWVALLRDAAGRRVAWIVAEYVQGERDLEGHAAAIKALNTGTCMGGPRAAAPDPAGTMPALRASVFYADVAGRQHDSHSGKTSETVLKAAGLTVKSRAMRVLDGIGMINQLLDPPETWGRQEARGARAEGEQGASEGRAGGEAGEENPRLLVDPRCPRVIDALTQYQEHDGIPLKDGIHDHVIDALRYALVGHDGAGAKVERRTY